MIKKTLGGDRLGSGKKMDVELHGYDRATFDLSYIWRSTMSPGTLVPFMSEVALPGDTFDIDLEVDVKTHPTVGPLFGSYKVQLDVFEAPMRLYNSYLHNNRLGVGMEMNKIFLPQLLLEVNIPPMNTTGYLIYVDLANSQMNPSCILSYLGIRGVGFVEPQALVGVQEQRYFNGVPYLAYWEIYKNYYANKQEEIGVVIHAPSFTRTTDVLKFDIAGNNIFANQFPSYGYYLIDPNAGVIDITFNATVGSAESLDWILDNLMLYVNGEGGFANLRSFINEATLERYTDTISDDSIRYEHKRGLTQYGVTAWGWRQNSQYVQNPPVLTQFPLSDIDKMRDEILKYQSMGAPFDINTTAVSQNIAPYKWVSWANNLNPMMNSQEGLGIKTYQSDMFNNWLQTEWIDGTNGITELTAIDTSGGSFTIDTLNLSKKVYDMLNRIAVSGGTYDDWIAAVYAHEPFVRAESPIYHGGLIRELVFQEVVSTAASASGDFVAQPVGTLAGKGVMAQKKKGGRMTIKVSEPGYIIGIVSITPRIDYSQGNKWDTHLQTLDDLHKPALDQIGFQELITEQMLWAGTAWDSGTSEWVTTSAGKQPAWMNYMTNVNQTRGNFAIPDNEMFMTLNRRYEWDIANAKIKDLTTYIDPVKYNFIFADTALDSQNFWAQIGLDIQARRKMSAKIMPNL